MLTLSQEKRGEKVENFQIVLKKATSSFRIAFHVPPLLHGLESSKTLNEKLLDCYRLAIFIFIQINIEQRIKIKDLI